MSSGHRVLAALCLGLACAPVQAPATAAPLPATAAAMVADASHCAEVIVYVVRGSGEEPQTGAGAQPYQPDNPTAGYSDTWDAFDPIDPDTEGSSIDADRVLDINPNGTQTVDTKTKIMYDLVQKVHERVGGQVRLSWSPIRYPAVPVPSDKWGFPPWLLDGYPKSVTSGIRELNRTLKRQWESCGTNTRYVLAGYSQGADVVNSYLRGKILTRRFGTIVVPTEYLGPTADIRGQIAAVALIADPNHDPADPESYSDLDPRLSQVGGQAGYRAGIPNPVGSATDSICIVGDPVCGQGTTIPELERGTVIHNNGYRDFVTNPVACHLGDETVADESAVTCMADRIVWRLGVTNLVLHPPDESVTAPGTTGRDVAFFIDTSASMSDDIDSAVSFASSQADRITALDGQVALVQYRDWEDDTPVEIVTPFTSDLSEFQAGLAQLYADGGGDAPEGLLHALMTGFNELEWRYGAAKSAVILTDAGFHEPDLTGGETLPQVERRSLEIDPVNVFPVVDQVGRYDELAARTAGQVIDKSSGGAELALGEALDSIAERPVAVLSNATYTAAAGRPIHFDASVSSATSGAIAEYLWDVDGDGFTDETTAGPTLNHTYPAGYAGLMQVLVVDSEGRSANASAAVLVEPEAVRGAIPRVPTAVAMQADAAAAEDHVALDVQWTPGTDDPARWVVAVDGDPVQVVEGSRHDATVPIPYQPAAWHVAVTPMDADGNYGPTLSAALQPLPEPPTWYERPVVWAAGVLAGLLGSAGILWLISRRRRAVAASRGPA